MVMTLICDANIVLSLNRLIFKFKSAWNAGKMSQQNQIKSNQIKKGLLTYTYEILQFYTKVALSVWQRGVEKQTNANRFLYGT